MRLAELKLIGFKSFARKTVFKFNEGEITGIVGPNGSGKSNIVDALRWVLGEQRAGLLRSDKMENVIFNGGAKQKPLGLAEVSLTIENDKNVLPMDYKEVVITRRLYRSGESQYFINGSKCRLKDIIDLFMDTGIGPDAYSVIELKMVESILSQNRQERRQLFEEASGITRYKKSRQSALRKLDSTREDLIRLNDIIVEIEKKVRSLSRQVSKARRYKEIKEQLKKLEINRAHWRYFMLLDSVKPLKEELENLKKSNSSNSTQLSLDEELLTNYQREVLKAEEKLKAERENLRQIENRIETLEREQLIENERRESNLRNLEIYRKEIEEIKTKVNDLKGEKANWQKRISEYEEEVLSFQNQYDDSFTQINELTEKINHQKELLAEKKGKLEALQKEINSLTEEKNKYQFRIDRLEADYSELKKQISHFSSDIDENRNELESKKKGSGQLLSEKEKLLVRRSRLNEDISKLNKAIDELKDEILGIRSRIRDRENQHQFFTDLAKNFTGFSDSVKKVMQSGKKIPGVIGPLANLFYPENDWEVALESALSELANVLVVESDAVEEQVLNFIGATQNTFLFSLERMRKYKETPSAPKPVFPSGKAWFLTETIKTDERIAPLARRIFNNFVLCDNLDTAKDLWSQFQDYVFITRKGEMVYSGGIVKAGSGESSHLTGREHLLKKLGKSIEKEKKELAERERKLSEINTDLQNKKSEIEDNENKISALESDILKIHSSIVEIETRLVEKKNLSENAGKRLSSIEEEQKRLADEMKEVNPNLEKLLYKEDDMINEIAGIESEIALLQEQYEKLSKVANEARLNLVQKQGALEQLQNQLKNSDTMNMEFLGTLHRREADLVRLEKENTSFEQNKIEREEKLIALWKKRDEESEAIRKEEELLESVREKARKTEDQLRQFRQAYELYLEKKQSLELKIHDAEIRAGNIAEQIREKYETELSEEPPAGEMALEQTELELEQLNGRLERLGEVNPLAVEEYEEENERLQFLLGQRSDLLDAEKKLLDTIKTINRTAKEQFSVVFEQIKENFSRVFKEFFENGEGTLLLEENVDPLEANVEISVRPKGRKPQTIALMSSGEKTLTAISLLFSIYLVKPSPFCILDEVDAPLDDVNIGRFTKAIRRFSDDTQFIIVTHNKKTMNVLDSVYGITQEEAGVSKVVSVDFKKMSLN